MKVSELYDEVALLGFENDIDEEATFYPALNTALHTVLRMIPQKRRAILAHYPPTPLVSDTNKYLYGGEELSYSAEGAKSFYMEISGKGSVSYKTYDSNGNEMSHSLDPTTWNNPYGYKVVRFLFGKGDKYPAKAEIIIRAEAACKIRCMALYSVITSDRKDDIPEPTEYVSYDLSDICTDFKELYEPPKLMSGEKTKALSDFSIDQNTLYLPRGITGDIEIVYIPTIPRYTANDGKMDIDIPDDCIGALKLLIASYVWLDDSEERAQYYKSLYNEEITLAVAKYRDINIPRYESVNNW